MIETAVICDVHGCVDQLVELLAKIGVILPNGDKNPDIRVIFVGDIIDAGRMNYPMNDLLTLLISRIYGDDFIWGNHDLPALIRDLEGALGFYGLRSVREMLPVMKAAKGMDWLVATDAHGFLITHAGLTNFLAERFVEPTDTAKIVADTLNNEFADFMEAGFTDMPVPYKMPNRNCPVIIGIGRDRGGIEWDGGILWCDVKNVVPIPHIRQIFGHSFIGNTHVKFPDGDWCIDTGKGNPSALVWEDNDWHSVYIDRTKDRSQLFVEY